MRVPPYVLLMDSAEARTLPLRGPVRALAATMRPKQWMKNALVIAAPGAAGALGHHGVPIRVGLATAAFCLLASGIYAVNDARDAPEDRLHPTKRHRPVAAGELDARTAIAFGGSLIVVGIAICAAISLLLALVGAAYVAVTISYTLVWRHVRFLDIATIAAGFVLRAVAGGVAAPVTLSRSFVLVVACVAVFVAGAKRYSELRRPETDPCTKRRVLRSYSPRLLELILAGSSAAAILAYSIWAFDLPSVHGVPWRPLTILPFAVCLLRYSALVQAGAGEVPEDLLLADRPLQVAAAVWLLLFALGVHAAS
jgi:decaprenyl-phosphate phosphoribosyltransferase